MLAAKTRDFFWRYGMYLLPLLLLALHIPFLLADPDVQLSHSRDAHSDEGLNTSQLRNFINYGTLDPWECDNLIKNPFFNLLLWAPLSLFGTRLMVGRLTVLLFVTVLLFLLSREKTLRSVWLWFIPLVMLQFHVFSYSHFSMAEMMATGFILAGIHQLARFFLQAERGKKRRHLFLSIAFCSLSWYTKIQFVYIIALVPMVFGSWWIYRAIKFRRLEKESWIWLLIAAGSHVVFTGTWYLGWYRPLRPAYTYIMGNQAADRFAHWPDFMPVVRENFYPYFTRPEVLPLLILFGVALPLGIFLIASRPGRTFRYLFPIASAWALIESHKLLVHFVPARYLVSSYVAMGLVVTAVCAELARRVFADGAAPKGRWASGTITLAAAVALLLGYGYRYTTVLQRRSYTIHQVNDYLARYSLYPCTAMGPWSASLTWDTRVRAIPVWSGFLNDHAILSTRHPRIIFAEPDEADSEQAFTKDGIDLQAIADSVRSFQVGRWAVNLYWMPADSTEKITLR